MIINNPTYDKILYESKEIMKQFKDERTLVSLSEEELDIMIQTIEYEIQKVTSYKGLFLSTLSIVIALILVVVTTNDMDIMLVIGLVSAYLIIMITYFFVTAHGITDLYKYLNKLRYVRANK